MTTMITRRRTSRHGISSESSVANMLWRTSSDARRRAVAAAISSTAASNAAAFLAAGARNPLIFRTYWSAAARMSWSVTTSAYGGRKVLMLRHITAAYDRA